MYSRIYDEQLLEFGHEGVLYRNSFVMYDKGSRTLWVHTTGQAVKGPLRGGELTFLPSEVVTWETWRDRHPKTLVLDRGGEDTGFMGTFSLAEEAEAFGFSVGSGTSAVLYPVTTMEHDEFRQLGNQVVLYDKDRETFRAFARGGRVFQLHENGELVDDAGSRWDAVTGESLNSEDAALIRLPATPWLIRRWKKFYPGFLIVEPTQ